MKRDAEAQIELLLKGCKCPACERYRDWLRWKAEQKGTTL